jgi:hypothetical protein
MSRTRTRSALFTDTFGSPERLLYQVNDELDVEGNLLDAEAVAGALVAMTDGLHVLEPSMSTPRQVESVLTDDVIPGLAASFSPFAMPVLLALGDLLGGRARTAATKAALRMLATGHILPVWSPDLAAPVVAHDCYRVVDGEDRLIELGCAFERAGRSWLVFATIDEQFGEVDGIDCRPDRSVAYLEGRFQTRQRQSERYAAKHDIGVAEFRQRVLAAIVPLTRPELDPYVFRRPDEEDLLGGPDGETECVRLRSWVSKVA